LTNSVIVNCGIGSGVTCYELIVNWLCDFQ